MIGITDIACPILFLYGMDKKFNFHPQDLEAQILARNDGSKFCGLPGGHWFYRDPQAKDDTFSYMSSFIDS